MISAPIWKNVAFADQSHYQNEFKQIMGTTPGRFIKRVRELQSDTSMGT